MQEKATYVIVVLETVKALVLKAESGVRLDEAGFMRTDNDATNRQQWIYPRFAENIQQLGANGLMSISTEKEF